MTDQELFYYKVIISYKGTNYSGWQLQTENPKTIQAEVERVVSSIVNYQSFQVIGASRTDTGVHANGQVLKIVLPKDIEPSNLTLGMNSKLPSDIRVIQSDYVDSAFNVNLDAKSKTYHYYFITQKNRNAALAETIYYSNNKLDIELIKVACTSLLGKNDFKNFSTVESGSNTIREITDCSIEKTSFLPFEEEIFYLKIEAKGYLKYMVRFIMGALFEIGLGDLSIDDFTKSLKTDTELKLKKKAPANGLHLIKIDY